MRRYSDEGDEATSNFNRTGRGRVASRPTGAIVSVLAHGGTGIVNTWGFAYVGGIVGLFTMSLLYVKRKVSASTSDTGVVTGLASLGPIVVVVGGVCGASFALGAATIVDSRLSSDVDASEVVAALCEGRGESRDFDDGELHDDIEHLIDDLDAPNARTAHQAAHDGIPSNPALTSQSIDQLINELVDAADDDVDTSCTG